MKEKTFKAFAVVSQDLYEGKWYVDSVFVKDHMSKHPENDAEKRKAKIISEGYRRKYPGIAVKIKECKVVICLE